jgi:phosphate-selective porin OprO/OprP
VTEGGPGAWEVTGRYSTLDLNDGQVKGGEMDVYSLGLNWWLTQSSQLGLNYRVVSLDRYGEKGWSSGLNVRLMLILD